MAVGVVDIGAVGGVVNQALHAALGVVGCCDFEGIEEVFAELGIEDVGSTTLPVILPMDLLVDVVSMVALEMMVVVTAVVVVLSSAFDERLAVPESESRFSIRDSTEFAFRSWATFESNCSSGYG